MADLQAATRTTANLIGICPHCDLMIYRCVSLARLKQVLGDLDITHPIGEAHVGKAMTDAIERTIKSDEYDTIGYIDD